MPADEYAYNIIHYNTKIQFYRRRLFDMHTIQYVIVIKYNPVHYSYLNINIFQDFCVYNILKM